VNSELFEWALRYLPRTVPLFGKVPAVGTGWPDWQATPDTLRPWFAEYGERGDANIGFRTGGGLVGLDVDLLRRRRPGARPARTEHGRLPATPTVVTGSDSRHHYFRGPRNLRSRNLRTLGIERIEIKAGGCQLVAPPSIHPDTAADRTARVRGQGRARRSDTGHRRGHSAAAGRHGWSGLR
jgi:hypothetical protein